MRKLIFLFVATLVTAAFVPVTAAAEVPRILAWQGVALDSTGAALADGDYTLTFNIYDAPVGGASKWTEAQLITITDGVMNVLVGAVTPVPDSVFADTARYLEVQFESEAPYSPRTRIASVGYAYRVGTVDGASGGALTSSLSIGTSNTDSASANGLVVGENNVINGPRSTVAGGELNIASGFNNFIGAGVSNLATGGSAVVGGGDQNIADGTWSAVLGGAQNHAGPGISSAVGGGNGNNAIAQYAYVGGGFNNNANERSSVVSGGETNNADSIYSTVAGGNLNIAAATGATVSGGVQNNATSWLATIGGGSSNNATSFGATVSGGTSNTAGFYGAVAGGRFNNASGSVNTIAGGEYNSCVNSLGAIGGGDSNTVAWRCAVGGGTKNSATGNYAMIPGGRDNVVTGITGFAAGNRAKANHPGAFVWGDSFAGDVTSSTNNQFTARTSGGARFYSNTALTTGVNMAAGGGSWTSISDRNLKANFKNVNAQEVLAKVAGMPMTTWNYISQDESIRHMGPMAQDLHAAFGLGTDDKHIATIDADGVALAAIQGLNLKLEQKLEQRDAEVEVLRAQLEQLQTLVESALANSGSGTGNQSFGAVGNTSSATQR